MKNEFQERIIATGTILYGACRISTGRTSWHIECSDDLFAILRDLTIRIEAYNLRHRKKGYVRAMKVDVEEGKLVFMTHRKVPCVEKWIGQARMEIRRHRLPIRQDLRTRARSIQTTALFASKLIPDWRRLLPDELLTFRRILHYAERRAMSKGDWILLGRWFSSYLKDSENAERCLRISQIQE